MFTVRSRGVLTQDKSGYFSNSKVYGKNGTGKKCSLIRGVQSGVFTTKGFTVYYCVSVFVRACLFVCMYVHACVRYVCVCVRACVRECMHALLTEKMCDVLLVFAGFPPTFTTSTSFAILKTLN